MTDDQEVIDRLIRESGWICAVAGDPKNSTAKGLCWNVEDATITAILRNSSVFGDFGKFVEYGVKTGPAEERRFSCGEFSDDIAKLVYSVLAKRGNASAAIALEAILDRELEEDDR